MEPPRKPRRGISRYAWLLAPLLFPLARLTIGVLPDAARLVIGFFALILAPGWLLQRLILPASRVGVAALVTRAFLLGIGLFSFLAMAAWMCGDDTGLLAVSAPLPLPPFPARLSTVVWVTEGFLIAGALVLALAPLVRRRPGQSGAASVARAQGRGVPGAESTPGTVAPSHPQPALHADARAPQTREAGGAAEPLAAASSETLEQRLLRKAYLLGEQHKIDRPLAPRWASLVVLAGILVFAAALVIYAGGDFAYNTDIPAHLAAVRSMVETDRILPRTAFHADGDGSTLDPRMGFFHVAMAGLAILARVDPVQLFAVLPALFTVFGLIVFHTLARRALRSEGTALLATFLALLCFGEAYRGLLPRALYGNQMAVILAWGVLSLALRFVSGDGRGPILWFVGIAAFAATATHIFAAVQILFTLGVLVVALLFLRGRVHRYFARGAWVWIAAALGCAPALAWRFAFAAGSSNPIHTHRQGLLLLGGGWYLVNPVEWAMDLGWIGWGAIVFSFLLWKRTRESIGVVYLASMSVAPLLVLLSPPVTRILEPYLGYLIARFAGFIPFVLVFAYMARWMGESLLDLTSSRRVAVSLFVFALMIVLLFPRLENFARSYSSGQRQRQAAASILAWSDLTEAIERETRAGATILSDPITGYAIPALTRHRSVAVLHQHASPADSLALARLAACRDVLSPWLGTGEKARNCRRFGADYVLVNAAFRRPVDTYFAHAGRRRAAREVAALERDDALFEKVWESKGRGTLFRVRRENLNALAGIVQPDAAPLEVHATAELAAGLLSRRLPEEAVSVLPDTVAGISLVGTIADQAHVARGDTLHFTLFWRRVGEVPRTPVLRHVRLESEVPRGRFWTPRFSKVVRLARERREHSIYRWRDAGEICDGEFAPEHWPRERFVADHALVEIPRNMVPGSYMLRVSWQEAALIPNFPLSHYFSDEDAYYGSPVGTVVID